MPITQLLKDAVDVYLAVLQREMGAIMVAEQATQSEVSKSDVTGVEGIGKDPQVIENCDTVSSECIDTNATNAAPAVMGL